MASEPILCLIHKNGIIIQFSQQQTKWILKIIENSQNNFINSIYFLQKLKKVLTQQLRQNIRNCICQISEQQFKICCVNYYQISCYPKTNQNQNTIILKKDKKFLRAYIDNSLIENEQINKIESSSKREYQKKKSNTNRLCCLCYNQRDEYFEPNQGSKVFCFICLTNYFDKNQKKWFGIEGVMITRQDFQQCLQEKAMQFKEHQNNCFQVQTNDDIKIQLQIRRTLCEEE